jgi:hypothetical protein
MSSLGSMVDTGDSKVVADIYRGIVQFSSRYHGNKNRDRAEEKKTMQGSNDQFLFNTVSKERSPRSKQLRHNPIKPTEAHRFFIAVCWRPTVVLLQP